MKKQFINPAVRVVKFETGRICEVSGSVHAEFHSEDPTLAPTRHGVFGENSEF